MNPCESFETEWSRWDPASEVQPLDDGLAAHLAQCAACRRRADTLRSTVGLLKRVAGEVPRPTLTPEFGARLLSRLEEAGPGPRRSEGHAEPDRGTRAGGRGWSWAWVGAAAAALGMVLLVMQDGSGPGSGPEGRLAGNDGSRVGTQVAGDLAGGGSAEWGRYRRALEDSPEALERLLARESEESLVLGQAAGGGASL